MTSAAEAGSTAGAARLDSTDSRLAQRTYTTVARRLLPLLGACYFLSYLDRTNVSVAALTMNADLRISSTAFGSVPDCSSSATSSSRCRAT